MADAMGALEKTTTTTTLPPPHHHHHLPIDILVDQILPKLPAKSLVRFKCVCKFMCALLAYHGFGVVHRSLSLTLPNRAGVLISIDSPAKPHRSRAYYTLNFYFNFTGEEKIMLQVNRVAYFDGEPPFEIDHLRSSSDGLICMYRNNGDVAVCNISTGQRISFPRIRYSSSSTCCNSLMLGFDPESKQYKVLMSALVGRYYKHRVLSVGVDKSWREINNNSNSYLFRPFFVASYYFSNYSHTSVYIQGVVYSYSWLTKDNGDPLRFDIVAFEVGSEILSVIPFSDEFSLYYLSEFILRKFALLEVDGGRLAIVLVLLYTIRDLFYIMNVWTWEKSKKCWEMITMTIPWDQENSRTIDGVRFTTNHAGEIVLLCIHSQKFSILVCNLKTKVWRKFEVGGVEEEFPIITHKDVRMCRIMDNVFPLNKV